MGASKELFTHLQEQEHYNSDQAYINEFYGTFYNKRSKTIRGIDRSLERLKIADIKNEIKSNE